MKNINPYTLEGKTLLITGSSRGIGAATAELAKEYGAEVILHGKTESKNLKSLSRKLGSRYIFCDVKDEESVKREVKSLGKIDVLVNNAGINPSKTFMNLNAEDWKEIIHTNLLGAVFFSQAILPGMLERKYGKIINVSSVKSYDSVKGKPAYASSKAALNRLTKSMAEEFAPNITVNAVSPGFTNTKMTKQTLSPMINSQINKIPLKRLADVKEIAEAILFLASNKSNYITGHILSVDGGLSVVSS
ncbi:SDR family oxidoreductase [Candidatus Pacearchaeota archaeon]|nr:SDR family oxidoreductase [Candidatus Pacearchaeota archaeon]